MIIQLKGKVKFPITLDSSVWIFDDRKITFDDAFSSNKEQVGQEKEEEKEEQLREMYSLQQYQQKIKPPVNKSLTRDEREKIFKNTYVMPLKPFVENAEIDPSATVAILHTDEEDVIVPLETFKSSYLLFAINGKPLKEGGPVHLYFEDGSNKEDPIKGFNKITFE